MVSAVDPIPELDGPGLRRFAFVMSAALVLILGLLVPWLFDLQFPLWPWAVAAALCVWGLVAPLSLRPVYRVWMRFGLLLNRVTTPLILGLIFFLIILPAAFVMRAIGRDTMARRLDPGQDSYRVTSARRPADSFRKPY